MDKFHFGAYWGTREETHEKCALSIFDTLDYLKDTGHPSFQSWYELGYSRKEALNKTIEISEKYLQNIVLKGKDKKFVDLGYSVSLWNGDNDDDAIKISFICGSYFAKTSNNINFNFPGTGEKALSFSKFETLVLISKEIVKIWNPDYLRIDSQEISKLIKSPKSINGYGWINYYSKAFQKEKVIKSPKFDESFEGYGDFLYVTKDLFSSDNPAHIEKLKELANQFKFKE